MATVSLEDTSRLVSIHKKKTTSQSVIKNLVVQELKSSPSSVERIIHGESNEVYVIRVDSKKYILRIGHRKKDRFAAEAWALQKANKAGVLGPKTLVLGQIKDKRGVNIFYCIQHFIEGITLDQLILRGKLNQKSVQTLTIQAGHYLAQIHSISTTGFGKLNAKGIGRYNSAEDMYMARKRQFLATQNTGLTASQTASVFTLLDNLPAALTLKPHLVHNDFGPKHIIVDSKEQIAGIIDFEEVESGDSSLDFAKWWYRYNKLIPIEWLFIGYEQGGGSLGNHFEERYKLAKAYRLLHTLMYFTDEAPSKKWADIARETLLSLTKSD